MKFLLPLLLSGAGLVLRAAAQDAPSFDYRPSTAVVYNAKDAASTELAKYYVKQRGIPEKNLVALNCTTSDLITRQQFINEIENPLRAEFDARKWWETKPMGKEGRLAVKASMRVLVIMQGVPLRIGETSHGKDAKGQEIPAQQGKQDAACVDSELAALGVLDKPIEAQIANPYFNSTTEFARMPLTPIFLVGRLDGPDKATVKRMIDDALTVEKSGLYGRAYVDLARKTGGGYEQGERWLIHAARALTTKGVPVVLDTYSTTFAVNYPLNDCGFYLGWYTDNADGPFLNPAFRFRQGAVAVHIHSFSAATLKSTKSNWCGPLLAKGACATVGNVFEPYLALTCALDVFTARLLAGFNLAEAAWAGTPALSWQNTVVGDPLYRPFAASPADGDKKFAADYKALRLAMTRWGGPDQLADLNINLTLAAETFKSAGIYEFLALRAQAGEGKSWPKAEQYFRLAEKTAAAPADKIRLQFLMADALRRDDDIKGAVKLLKGVVESYPNAPEAVAARTLMEQIK